MDKRSKGYVKYFRSFIDEPWYKDRVIRVYFEHCLLSANWEDKEWNGQIIKKGSFITSRAKFMKDTGLTEAEYRRAEASSKSSNMISTKTTNKFTEITVINWDKYQLEIDETSNKTTSETSSRTYTTKEDKETKEERKIEDINNICHQLGFNYLSDDQFRQVKEIWLKNYSISAIRDFVQIAKRHNAKNLFAYVNTMVHRTLEPAPRFDVNKNKKELVEYNWWEED